MSNKKTLLFITGGIIMTTILSGCTSKKKEEIEQSFDQVLALYPTKDLMDFYEMEGYRDEEFDEGDKGVWVLDSSMSISNDSDSPLITEGMLLKINRNKGTAEGFYYQWTIPADIKNNEMKEKIYPITYDKQEIHLLEEVDDPELKEKIENFQFFVQYGDFKNLVQYEHIRKMYNPNVPIYELEYQLENDDPNVQQLRQRYQIPTENAPTLLLKGRGNLAGDSVGYKNVEIRFSKNPSIVFDDSIDYQPDTEEDNQ
ncbi:MULTISPECIES: tandem-type lipoprotein [unclassified Enterococcus]|uniref:tandem-type lipoprotein n=1 Tax=unclassified Enterococcus TaxID=2608891 RepID=UPI0013ED3FC1|nr:MULTISPECIES: tandem-type lipoprotein [unclassified Enterococcus]